MKKRIFEKGEDGNFIINFANVDFDYYAAVANSDTADFDTGSFIMLSFYENDEGLYRDLKEKRLIDSKSLVYRVNDLKKKYIRFAKKNLVGYNSKLTDEQTKENILAILDEYEKAFEYTILQSLVGKTEITQADLECVEEKRQFMYDSLVGVKDIHAFVISNYELCSFILNHKDYDERIRREEKEKGKSKYSFHYDFLKKNLTPEQIEEARKIVLAYKKKFKLDNITAVSDILSYCELQTTQAIFERDRQIVELLFEREVEYKKDLKVKEKETKKQEDEKKRREEEAKRRKEKAEEEKRRKETEKYTRFETYGTYGPRERVLPLALNFFGARGETLTEVVGDEKVNGLFDTIKGIKFRRNERPAIIIFSDCNREEALRVLADFRAKAKENGLDERIVEGITTEYGEELIFDETTSRPIVLRGMVEDTLTFLREHNSKKHPKLKEMDTDRSYLVYSLEGYKKSPKELEKLRKNLKDDIGVVRYIEDDTNGILYGVTREKYPSRVRARVARYLDLKYQVDKKILDAFRDSKKLAEYEIDEEDVTIN